MFFIPAEFNLLSLKIIFKLKYILLGINLLHLFLLMILKYSFSTVIHSTFLCP